MSVGTKFVFVLISYITIVNSCADRKPPESRSDTNNTRADSIFQQGNVFYDQGNLENAKKYYQLAIKTTESDDVNDVFPYFSKLIELYMSSNNYGDAIAVIDQFESMQLMPEHEKNLIAYYSYQVIYLNSLQYDKALSYNDKILKISRAVNDSVYVFNTLMVKKDILIKKGETATAFKLLDSLNNNSKNLSSTERSFLLNDLGTQKFKNGEFNDAIKFYKEYLNSSKESSIEGRSSSLSVGYANIAEAYIETGEFDKALTYLDSFKLLDQGKVSNHLRRSVFKYELRLARQLNFDNNRVESLIDSISTQQELFYANRYSKELDALVEEKLKSEKFMLASKKAELEKANLEFRTLLIVFILSLIISIILYWVHKQKKDHLIYTLTNQQRLLRSQMNPHFIFNVLSSIQNLLNDEHLLASRYITKFSRLLRIVLKNSMHNYVLLEDEITVLKNYISLQQLRFPEAFDVNFTGEVVDDESLTFVPPMLIQPFIENAIEHGFKGISYKGKIEISLVQVKLEKYLLQCTIKDNGVGFTKNNHVAKKSTSIKLINDFLKKTTKRPVSIIRTQGDYPQTVVNFFIPLK